MPKNTLNVKVMLKYVHNTKKIGKKDAQSEKFAQRANFCKI